MKAEILKLLYDYSQDYKIADTVFVDKLITIIVTNKELNRFVKKVDIQYRLEKYIDSKLTLANYGRYNHKISIGIADLQAYAIISEKEIDNQLDSSLEKLLYINFKIIEVICHELEHAMQFKIKHSTTQDSEAILTRICYSICSPKNIPILLMKGYSLSQINDYFTNGYIEKYAIDPLERMAEIKTLRFMKEIIEPIKVNVPNLYKLKLDDIVSEYIKGYTQTSSTIISPTWQYLYKTNHQDDLNKFSFYNQNNEILHQNLFEQHNLTERLIYGFPITVDEYKKVRKLTLT